MRDWLLPFLAAAATGVLSAWGVGGGTLLLLVMTLFLGVDQEAAQSINLLYFLPTAAVSLYFHAKNDLLDKKALKTAIPWGFVAAVATSLLIPEAEALRRPFGVFLLLSAASLLWKSKKQ